MKRTIFLIILLIGLAAPSVNALQIDIQAQGFAKFKVAMPHFSGDQQAAKELREVLEKDIKISGVFELIDVRGYINPGPMSEVAPGTLKDWALIGADYVITGGMRRQGSQLISSLKLMEVSSGKLLVSSSYTTAEGATFRAAHAFMDSMLDRSLGLPGVFNTKIACTRKVGDKKQIYTAWCDGSGGRVIEGLGSLVLNPAWHPDGTKLAFVSYWGNNPNPNLYLLDMQQNVVSTVSERRGINTTPTFTPDGKGIAFTQTLTGDSEIYLTDLGGQSLKRLTRSNWSIDTSPSFSPDGKQMVFCSNRSGNPNIYIKDMVTGNAKRLTFSGKYNTDPVFSPRGDLIAFTYLSPDDGKFHVAFIRPDGSRLAVLPGSGQGDEAPAFSPDGRLIAFQSADGNIYITDLGGSAAVQITDGRAVYAEPSWSPVLK